MTSFAFVLRILTEPGFTVVDANHRTQSLAIGEIPSGSFRPPYVDRLDLLIREVWAVVINQPVKGALSEFDHTFNAVCTRTSIERIAVAPGMWSRYWT